MKTLQYATVNFEKKKALKITAQQYLYLDSVRVLQANPKYKGWAYASNEYYSIMFDMTIRGVQKMSKAMIEKGLLAMGKGSLRQLTAHAYDLITYEQSSPMNKVHTSHEQSSPQTRTKFTPSHEQSSPNSNKDNKENKERDSKREKVSPLVSANREKTKATKKAYEARVNFKDAENPISELETFINTNLIDKLNKYPSFSKMNHKEEFLKDFSEKAITEDWNGIDDLTLHISRSIKFFTPKELPQVKRAQVKYVYKVNGSEFRHSDTKKFEMDKRNFTGYGFEEIRVNA